MDLYELQSKLKKNEALLIYNTKGDSNFSWVITNNDYVITPLGDYDLKKNINLTRQSIDNKFLNQNSTFDYHSSEKLYETLLTKEEMVRAKDMGEYYRIPVDGRDLNYQQFFEDGKEIVTQSSEYHSHNTHRLDDVELKKLLLSLKEIQGDLKRD